MEPKTGGNESAHSGNLVEEFIEQEIRLHPEQLATVLMNAPNVGVAICDSQLLFRGINDALAAINGVPAKEHFGRSIYDILGDVAEKIAPLFRHVISTGKPVLNIHLTGILPTRKEPGHWIENYFPLKDAQGRVNRLCSVVIEVTEQKKLEESLRLLTRTGKDDAEQLRLLAEFHSGLVAGPDLGELTGAITAFVNRVIPHDYAMLDLEDEVAEFLAGSPGEVVGTRILSGLGRVVSGQASHGRTAGEDTAHDRAIRSLLKPGPWDQMLGPGIESVYNMALATQKSVLGTLHLASRQKDAFAKVNRELAERVATQIALALDYIRANKEIDTLKSRLAEQKIHVQEPAPREEEFSEILGASPALEQVLNQARMVANADCTVLLLGETGTGKDLMASAIHRLSRRKQQNFVKINCAASSTRLLESELFGHEKGAFSGAVVQKIGRLELADEGTLLLDEIGDLPQELQPKLLRFLQDGEFERLGGTRTIRVNVRLIAATNRDLAKRVADGRFRSDLFDRLNVFSVRMPALRERREDIPQLVRHFVKKFSHQMGKNIETIPNQLMEGLQQWEWPGNVRELEQFVERSAIMTPGTVLRGTVPELDKSESSAAVVERTLEAVERDYILQALRGAQGRVSGSKGAAVKLGMKRTTLQSRMQKLKIQPSEYKTIAR
jgi:formate hydrogenlyase transcriptional activator